MTAREKGPARVVAALLPFAIATAALIVRVVPPWKQVFLPHFTCFAETDAWYHMRIVDMMVANFPRVPSFDPFLVYPHGGEPPLAPMFPWSIAAVAWMLGRGHPSPSLIDAVGAWMPALLGALTVFPIFICARKMWSRGAATIAALLMALMPSEFLGRSILGYTDHHVVETLLSSCVILFLMISFRAERRREGYGWSAAAGMALAAYLLTWRSGIMFLAVLFAALLIAIVVRASMGLDASSIAVRSEIALFTALVIVAPAGWSWREASNDAISIAAVIAAIALTALAARGFRRLPSYRHLLVGAAAGVAVVAAIGFVTVAASSFARGSLLDLHRLMPRSEAALVSESTPLLQTPRGILVLFDEFGAAGFLAIGGLGVLIDRIRRDRDAGDVIFAVWSAAMFVAALAQVRFTYYLAAAVALLCGFFWWALIQSEHSARRRIAAAVIVVLLVFAPIVPQAIRRASITHGPPAAWRDALLWMRAHTPEPLGTDTAYYEDRRADPRYGVLAWWDFGYWITRIAHRVPVTNPTQWDAGDAARALTTTTEAELDSETRRLGVRYIIVDDEIPVRRPTPSSRIGSTGFLPVMCVWSGQPLARYFERVAVDGEDGSHREVLLFYPDYYRAMGVRLFLFGVGSAEPSEAWVATLIAPREGSALRRLTALQRFATNDAAEEFASMDPARRVVGIDPLRSCVAIPALTQFRQVYASPAMTIDSHRPAVGIFERIE